MAGELVKNQGYSPRSAIGTAINSGFHMHFVGGVVFERYKESAGAGPFGFCEQVRE